MKTRKRKPRRRELIVIGKDRRYVRRDRFGRFAHVVDVRRSLKADRKRKARKKVRSGFGDRGDR